MLSEVVIMLQTLMDTVKEGDQKPENLKKKQRSHSIPCGCNSALPYVTLLFTRVQRGSKHYKTQRALGSGSILCVLHLNTSSWHR